MTEFLDPSEDIQKHGTNLPHWQQSDAMQFVTFRLGDAMPQEKLRQWKQEFAVWKFHHPKPWSPEVERDYQKRFIWRLEHWLDEVEVHGTLLEAATAQDCAVRVGVWL